MQFISAQCNYTSLKSSTLIWKGKFVKYKEKSVDSVAGRSLYFSRKRISPTPLEMLFLFVMILCTIAEDKIA
jgi:hypothetical protein